MNPNPLMEKAALQLLFKGLKMPGAARVLEEVGRQARQEGWSYEAYLREVLDAEERSRSEGAIRNRLRAAGFPMVKTLEQFDFSAQPELNRERLHHLMGCQWVAEGRSVILAGPVGTGKTHLATALGVSACQHRYHVRFERVEGLVRQLTEARSRQGLSRLMKRLEHYHVLILDELGFVSLDREGAELLFHVIAERHPRKSTVVTTNLPFSEWVKVFGEEKLTVALLDRLGEGAQVLTTQGASYRMRQYQGKGGASPSEVPSPRGVPPLPTPPLKG